MNFKPENPTEAADTNAEKNRGADGYPNKRREKAAQHLIAGFRIYFDKEEFQLEDERCRFILKYADSVLAANYLTHTGHFLYAQAVKDHFWLPCSLPDEDEERRYKFFEVVRKIARYDIPLSLEIWRWCLSRFLPFAKYAVFAELEMSGHVLESLYGFPDGFLNALVHSIDTDHVFREQITRKCTDPHNAFPDLVAVAVKENLEETALFVFRRALEQAGQDWEKINLLVRYTISGCKRDRDIEPVELFREKLFPLVKAIRIGMVQDEIDGWEQDMANFVEREESQNEKYAYSRRNAWRKTAPDGSEYGLEPRHFASEEEYLEALNERKYAWRKHVPEDLPEGLHPEDYELQRDFYEELRSRQKEKWACEREKLNAEYKKMREGIMLDKTVYDLCGVVFPESAHPYSYRTDGSVEIGDIVEVPVGNEGKHELAEVVSVERCTRAGTVFSIEKLKTVIRIVRRGGRD